MLATVPLRAFTGETYLGDPNGHFWSRCSTTFLADKTIPDAEKVALQAIVSLGKGATSCGESNAEIGKACGKDEKTVGRLIMRLERRGIITREPHGPTRTIRLNFGFRGKSEPTANLLTSEEVKGPITSSDARGQLLTSEEKPPHNRGGNSALPRTTLRLNPEKKDPDRDRESASAGRGQGPPPPPPAKREKEEPKATAADVLSPNDLAEARRLAAWTGKTTFAHSLARLSLLMHRRAIEAGFGGEVVEATGWEVESKQSGPVLPVEVETGPLGDSLTQISLPGPIE